MGFVKGLDDVENAGGSVTNFVGDLTGKNAAKAAKEAAALQATAGQTAIEREEAARATAQGFFSPFEGIAEQGANQAGFLADPQAQFDFLQNNPLFKLALENANQDTLQRASSVGRVNAGDTLQDLSNNVLLSASPLIDRQRQDIFGLLNIGTGLAANQANIETGAGASASNLLTDIGAARAGGLVGAANARTAGAQGLVKLATDAAGAAVGGAPGGG